VNGAIDGERGSAQEQIKGRSDKKNDFSTFGPLNTEGVTFARPSRIQTTQRERKEESRARRVDSAPQAYSEQGSKREGQTKRKKGQRHWVPTR